VGVLIARQDQGGELPVTSSLTVAAIYDEYFEYVWCALKRLGVPPEQLDDAVQDVFLIVHRRLPDFEQRSTIQTWLFGIALRVAREYRKRRRRGPPLAELGAEQLRDQRPSPLEAVTRAQASEILYRMLDELGGDQREVFVLMEIEEITAPRVAEMLGLKLNTVYSRLRAARAAIERAAARLTRRSP
jgi:RNA polymerase sigma-70 factor (ECF subfamily)